MEYERDVEARDDIEHLDCGAAAGEPRRAPPEQRFRVGDDDDERQEESENALEWLPFKMIL